MFQAGLCNLRIQSPDYIKFFSSLSSVDSATFVPVNQNLHFHVSFNGFSDTFLR